MEDPENGTENQKRLSLAGGIAIAVMLAMLGWTLWYAVQSWSAMDGVRISRLGWIFMGLGVVVTFLVGAGLMGLVFYSSRTGRDI